MNNSLMTTDTKIGTVNGTLLALLYCINTGELFKTCLFAATGAVVSFFMSICCKWAWNSFRKKKQADQS